MEPLWDWLAYQESLTPARLQEAISAAIETERDCELRVLNYLDMLPEVDKIDYIRQSNTYLYFYAFIRRYRLWCSNRPARKIPQILAIMPEEILPLESYYQMPTGYEQLVWKYCVKSFSSIQ